MIGSLRARLALWYGLTLGICLTALGWGAYSYLARETSRQIDESLRDVTTAFAQLWRSARTELARPNPEDMLSSARADNFEFVVFDEAQREIASNSRTARLRRSRRLAPSRRPAADSAVVRPDLAPLFREAGARGEAFATLEGVLGSERAYAVAVSGPGGREIIAVIEDLDRETRMLATLRRAGWWIVPAALALAVGGGAFLAGRALRPVGDMAIRAERIEASTLHERLRVANAKDELGHLAGAFNRLLGRLEEAFERQRRFMAEASHELRTPISVVRAEADLALSRPDRPGEEYREALTVISGEGRRMTRVVEDLFLLARVDAGQLPISRAPVTVGELAQRSIRAVQTLAQRRSARVELSGDAGDAIVEVDARLIERVLINLLDNAIKYGREGGAIGVALGRGPAGPTIEVRDDGPGVTPEARPRIFDRFYRGPEARGVDPAGETGGAGLGLAIAKSLAEMNGARLSLANTGPEGTTFRLEFTG